MPKNDEKYRYRPKSPEPEKSKQEKVGIKDWIVVSPMLFGLLMMVSLFITFIITGECYCCPK